MSQVRYDRLRRDLLSSALVAPHTKSLFLWVEMEPFLLIGRRNSVVTVTLNRPNERNAISKQEYVEEVVSFCRDAARDSSIGAVILTGSGSAFCAGGDVKAMRDRSGMFEGSPVVLRGRYRDGIQQLPLALHNLEIPVIAAINGPAIGAGLDLACMCDIRLAATTAIFAESFVKLGVVPGDGGAWLLPRIIGTPRATLMTLTGASIDSATALEYCLVTEVLPAEALLPRAQEIAEQIAANPRHATRLAKRLLREGENMNLDQLLDLSAAFQALAHYTEDHAEAVDAFINKRPPSFKGR